MEFFPGVQFPPDLCHPENLSHWLSTLLHGMGEVPLPRGADVRVYRVLAQPTWGSVCTIRLEAICGRWRVAGRRGCLPRNLPTDRPQEFAERQLADAESTEVEGALARLALWSLPVLIWDGGAVDGTQWLVEGSEAGRYHAIVRCCPEELVINEWCHLAHELSGLGREQFRDRITHRG